MQIVAFCLFVAFIAAQVAGLTWVGAKRDNVSPLSRQFWL